MISECDFFVQGIVVRFAPAADAPVVGELEAGAVDLTVVSVVASSASDGGEGTKGTGTWLEIETPFMGWISLESLRQKEAELAAEEADFEDASGKSPRFAAANK